MEPKTHWRKVFNSDYLGSCDLDDGKDLKAIIKSVSQRGVKNTDGKEQKCNVAVFTDPKIKPMVLNATNCKVIKRFAKSPFINDWNNIPVQIYVKDDIKAFGEVTEGLRIRSAQPSIQKPFLTPDMKAWGNAIEFLKSPEGIISKVKDRYQLTPENEQLLKDSAI